MKHILIRNSIRKGLIKRFIALLLLLCIILQNNQYSITVWGKEKRSTGTFEIPYGADLKHYDPDINGYYAYLPIKYEASLDFSADNENIFKEVTVPGFVIKNTFFVSLHNFTTMTGAIAIEESFIGKKYKIGVSIYERHAFLTEGDKTVSYVLGKARKTDKWLDYDYFQLDAAPIVLEDDIYVPLMELMAILQIPFFVNRYSNEQDSSSTDKAFLQIERAEKNVYDVLAEIKGDDSLCVFTFGDADVSNMMFGANLSTSLHNMLHGNLSYVLRAVCLVLSIDKGEQYFYDNELSKEFLGYILNITEEEGSIIDQINAKNSVELASAAVKSYGDEWSKNVVACYDDIIQNVKKLPASKTKGDEIADLIRERNKLLEGKKKEIDSINKKLSNASKIIVAALIVRDLISSYSNYKSRDELISNGLANLFSEESKIKYKYTLQYMGEERLNAIERNFPEGKKEMFEASLAKSLWNNLDDILEILSGFSNSLLFIYRIVSNYVPVYGALLQDMENFKVAYFGLAFQYDTRAAALNCLDKIVLCNADEDTIMDGIELTSLYLKTCYVVRDCVIKALRASEDKEEFQDLMTSMRISRRMIAENLVALSIGYPAEGEKPEDILPARATAVWEDFKNKKDEFYKLLIPLYMRISGEVRSKKEGEPPVTDAECNISKDSEKVGFIKGTDENGKFSVYVPVIEAKTTLEGISELEDIKLMLEITSPTVQGNKKVSVDFEPAGHADIGVIYLDDFNWYEYIRDEILPDRGYVSLETTKKVIGQNWVYPETWDYRKGLLSAQITDINDDGIEDCILYIVDYSHLTYVGGKHRGYDDPKTTIHVMVLTKNMNAIVIKSEKRQIIYDDSIGFCDAVGGILEVDGKKYIYFECNTSAYYSNTGGTLYSFFTFDGSNMRPEFAVGKTGGGSSGFEYALITYDENGAYNGKNVTTDGQIWYQEDGNYSKKILWDENSSQQGMSLFSSNGTSSVEYEAVFDGLSEVTNMVPDFVEFPNGNYSGNTVMPTLRTSEYFTQAFHYNCNGSPSGSNGARSMTVSLEDNTELKKHIDEITP